MFAVGLAWAMPSAEGRDPTNEPGSTSYAGQDQQGAAVNCGMVYGGALVNGVCYYKEDLLPPEDTGSGNNINNGDPIGDAIDAGVDAVGTVIDWWEDDPLNGPAEEAFDGLNTAVETLGDGSEVMNDVAIDVACHPVGNGVLGLALGALPAILAASTCHYND